MFRNTNHLLGKSYWPLTKPDCPGYGDLSLNYQKDIIEFLQAKKNIGVSLTESLMMVPVKSVTAIIGIGKEKNIRGDFSGIGL